MNLDMTFCSGLRCERTGSCERWIGHLKGRTDAGVRYISQAQFGDDDGKCDYYLPIMSDEEFDKEVHKANKCL